MIHQRKTLARFNLRHSLLKLQKEKEVLFLTLLILCTKVLIFDTLIKLILTITTKADTGSISPIISETIILFEECFFSTAKI